MTTLASVAKSAIGSVRYAGNERATNRAMSLKTRMANQRNASNAENVPIDHGGKSFFAGEARAANC